MKIIKPLKLSLLKKTYTFLGQHYLVISPVCFFRLGSAEVLTEMPQWPVIQKNLGPMEMFDIAMPKTQGEVLLAGHAFAADQQPVPQMNIELAAGAIAKRLLITGDRQWRRGLLPLETITAPEAFLSMPLHAANAYGGDKFALNPAGKGHLPLRKRLLGKSLSAALPNIEDPAQPFKKISQHYQPEGFGPVAIELPPRNKKAGTYDDHWQKNHFPGYAPDIDWSIFNAARENQQINGFWQGNEHYQITGMHPQQSTISGTLPGVKARAFIRNQAQQFSEIDLVADTLWLFPEDLLGAIIFRGQSSIEDSDGLDISTLMLAYEHIQGHQRSHHYYQQVMALRTDKVTQLAYALNEAQLSPVKSPQQLTREQQEVEREEQRLLAMQKQAIAEIIADNHLPADIDIPEPTPNPLPIFSPESIKRGDIDLSDFLEKADKEAKRVQLEGEQKLADLKQQLSTMNEQLEAIPSNSTAATPAADLQEKINQQCTEIEKNTLQQPAKFSSAADDSNNQSTELTIASLMDSYPWVKDSVDKTAVDPATAVDSNLARRYATEASEPAEPLPAAVKNRQRTLVEQLLAQGKTLAGRDLAGADLSGMDFSQQDMREVMLEKTILDGCNFSGADLSSASLVEANLDNCNFSRANLSQANLSNSSGWAVNFTDANFKDALLIEGTLQNCRFNSSRWDGTIANNLNANHSDFSLCVLTRCVLVQAQLLDSDWVNAKINETIMIEANLNYARCQNITIYRSALIKATANVINLSGATLTSVQTGGGAEFIRANFYRATIAQSGFRTTDMRASNFSNSHLSQCDFGESNLSYSNFNASKLPQCILSGADISHCDCSDSNFYMALGRKVTAYQTRFNNSDFLYMDWQQAQWKNCDYSDSKNLNTTALELSA